MTKETSKPNSSSSSGGGGRRNRGRGKRGNNKRLNGNNGVKGSGSKKAIAPPPPQVKLALRNIGNPAAFGTAKAILEKLIQPLMELSNDKTALISTQSTPSTSTSTNIANGPYILEMDGASKRFIIDEEEAAAKYLKEEAAKRETEQKKEEIEEEDPVAGEGEGGEESQDAKDAEPTTAEEAAAEQQVPSEPEVVVAPVVRPAGVSIVTLRPLYVVPPKQTRRRGERCGVAYILLTAPKIEKIEVPNLVVEETVEENSVEKPKDWVLEEAPKDGVIETERTDDLPIQQPTQEEEDKQEDGDTPPASVDETPLAKDATETPAPVEATSTDPAPIPAPKGNDTSSADYSRSIARGKVLLQRAVKMLTELAKEDGKSSQNFGQVVIETALSGKTWRWQNTRPDRREGTLESTSDYKNWLKGLEKKQEDLKARPRPTPGGAAGASGEDANGTGEAVAAIVQHLRAKRLEMKRKKAKKKGKTDGAAGGGKEGKGSKGKRVKGASSEGNGKKKTKKRPKKKSTGNQKAVAPTALLKPDIG